MGRHQAEPRVARCSQEELPALDDVTAPWPGRHVDLDGTEIFVRITKPLREAAEPALLVHGLGGSSHNWTDVAGLLRNRLDIEAIDLPGFGRSGPSRSGYSLDQHARTVIDYLRVSGRGPVHLVGNSMGGAVSILVASRRPDLVRTLTLISPAVPDVRLRLHPLRNDPRVALIVVPVIGPAVLRRMRKVSPRTRAKLTIDVCFADPSRYPQRRMDESVEEASFRLRFPWADRAMISSMRALAGSQFFRGRAGWAAMRTITAPTLVVWGDTDRLVAPDLAPIVANAIPDSRLLFLVGVGHTAQMEDPTSVARAVLALLDDAAIRAGT